MALKFNYGIDIAIYMPSTLNTNQHSALQTALQRSNLLVERLGVGGGGRDVGITGGLVGAGGLLQLPGAMQVGVTGNPVSCRVLVQVVVHVGESGKHCCGWIAEQRISGTRLQFFKSWNGIARRPQMFRIESAAH